MWDSEAKVRRKKNSLITSVIENIMLFSGGFVLEDMKSQINN